MPRTAVRLTVLGPVRAWLGDTEVDLGSPQQRALLALLLAHAGQPVAVAEILTAIWGASRRPRRPPLSRSPRVSRNGRWLPSATSRRRTPATSPPRPG